MRFEARTYDVFCKTHRLRLRAFCRSRFEFEPGPCQPDAHNKLSYESYDLLWRRPRRPWRRHAAEVRHLVVILLPRIPKLCIL